MTLRLDLEKQHFLERSKNPDVNRRVQALASTVCRIISKRFSEYLPS